MKVNSARLRKLEMHRERLRDLRQMTDAQLCALIADELGISPEEVEAMSDDELELVAGKRTEMIGRAANDDK